MSQAAIGRHPPRRKPGFSRNAAGTQGAAAAIARTEQQWSLYSSNQGYHDDGSGRFFIRLGDACATAMVKPMGRK